MRLVCDSCGSKYSIGDDRVAGKVFKIRCKKCSHVMVIRGAAPAVETAQPVTAETVATPSGEWHVVIAGEQAGPFAREEVLRRHAAGELADDAFVWREGMAEWTEISSVDEFRAAPAEVAPAPAEPTLVNARNENSLLFTLDKLAQLAATQPQKPSAPASATAGPTEGSGLIDIRKIANSYLPQNQRDLRPASSVGSADDLPSYGPAAFGEPIAIVPALAPRGGDRKLLFALVAAVGMLAILAAILVVVLTRGDSPRARPVAETPAPGTRLAAITPEKPPVPPANPPTADVPPAPVAAPPAPVVAPAPVSTPTPPAPRTPRTPRTQVTPTTPNPLVVKPPPKNECTEVSCIINGFKDPCCVAFKKEPTTTTTTTTTTTPPSTNLPDNLDRVALGKGLATIAAQSCGGRSSVHGDVSVSIKVSPGGAVSGVTIKSSPDPALSACVEAAARKGSFAKSQRGATVAYMWRF